MKRAGWILGAMIGLASIGAQAGEAGVRLVEAKFGKPLPSGVQILQLRMTPSETATYTRILFICRLRQEFPYKGSDNKTVQRVLEPADFTHREDAVRMTAELDYYVNIRLPLQEEELVKAYGKRTFRAGIPVTVSKVRVEARDESGLTLWSVDAPVGQVTRFP